ncbi:MAG: alpha/beta hydrolase [Phycisphaerales bacterium]|nr:alpha/beta hydrolase [Phycisphaerales bacterium]
MPALLGLIQLIAIGAIGFWIVLVIHTAWSLLHPPRRTYAYALSRNLPSDPSELDQPLEFESLQIESKNQTLHGWKIKALNPSGPRIVLVHGWGSSSIGALKRIPSIASNASEIITLDLPGHGESTGTAQMGTSEHEDLDALLSSLDESKPTLVYGWSMGAGIALRFARDFKDQHDIRAVIAESIYIHAITPARNVIRLRGLPTKFNLKPAMMLIGLLKGVGMRWDGFARDQIAQGIQVPVVLIHGTQDPVSPIEDSRSVLANTDNAKLIEIKDGGHNNLWTVPEFAELAREGILSALDPEL